MQKYQYYITLKFFNETVIFIQFSTKLLIFKANHETVIHRKKKDENWTSHTFWVAMALKIIVLP
jgi:hypothetical protein